MSALLHCATCAKRKLPFPHPPASFERTVLTCPSRHSYKTDVPLRFITEELGFDADGDAVKFLLKYDAAGLLEERDSVVYFQPGKAKGHFDAARAQAFRRVDIKGQI